MEALAVLIISSIVPIGTLIYTVLGMRHKAEIDYVGRLEKRLEECEDDRTELHRQIDDLRDELRQARTQS